MRVAYFDPFAGAAGDMIVGALIDAGAPLEGVRAAVLSTGLEGVELSAERTARGGLAAARFVVKVSAEGPHRHLADLLAMTDRAEMSPRARERAAAVFRRLAEAEGRVHGIAADEVHFHEVGAADSVSDVIGAAAALELIGADEVASGPPALGHDATVKCAHGEIPVPPPAVLELLRGRKVRPGLPGAEMTTPTGAAVLSALAGEFGPPPEMELESVGCGAGGREDERLPNLLRVMVGRRAGAGEGGEESLLEIAATIDDIPGEVLGYLFERLPGEGALEVSLLPATLKKNRAGFRLSVLAPAGRLHAVARCIFRETTTLGLRYSPVGRIKLERRFEEVSTRWGPVRVKCGLLEGEVVTASPEYEDCRRLAGESGAPL
ncbi:MAG: nickel pincer cofactor biosynthesis protein LarC, partial [Planctomycetota bacterium]